MESCMRLSSTLANTLPGTDNNVIPRQLLHSVTSPFFGSGMMVPFFQSAGNSSWCCTINGKKIKTCNFVSVI